MTLEIVLRVLYTGVTTGAIYAAVAVGFNVIYRSGRVFNIAQGEMVMIATFMMVALMGAGFSPWTALVLSGIGMALVGLAVERLVLRRLVGQPEMALFMATLGVLLVMNGLGHILIGAEPQIFPELFGRDRWRIAGVNVRESVLVGTALIVALIAGLAWFFNATRTGLLMTAVAESHQTARSLGVNVRASIAVSWAVSGVISTVAAAVFMGGRMVSGDVASIAFVALPVVLLAGLETIGGVLIGGIIVGVGQAAAARWLDPLTEGGASLIFPFALMLVLLMIRPQGLFGWKHVERI
ncbi:branched-chain amino acid ABC transporter permease [Ruixingdingia sedimenti]|uniref:Branched-chain amino acid ABC transporter permease n=1 Tax=Ruixingdingia sedimenti TaxID=3073604 RepID=A0ABU1FD01_9RHOB|nr:branched-chain amino acid ABC transporter permease [Xinfangfangia sp. LG-4]MDR5654719.1 branched-chain amino acid ABC transporter permease [Xinfangfangia sp. LG-4]